MQLNNNYLLLLVLLVFACKSEEKKEKNELKNANFVINDQDLKKAFVDFQPDSDTISVKQDDQKSFKVKVGDEVVFKDVSEPMNAVHEREWDFDNDAEVDDNEQIAKFKFKSPGLYEVKLMVNEKMVSKMVYVYDASTSNIASVEKIADVNGNENTKPSPTQNQVVAVERKENIESKNPVQSTTKTEVIKPAQPLLADAKTRESMKSANPSVKEQPKVIDASKPIAKSPPALIEQKKEIAKPVQITQPEVKKEVAKPTQIAQTDTKKDLAKSASSTTPPQPNINASEAASRMKSFEKAGASSKSKPEEDGEWVEKANILLTPQVKCKLAEFFTYPNSSGKVKITIKNNQNGQSANTTSNVNKGKSQLILDDLDDMTLEPGNTYTLMIEPQNGLKIENAISQNVSNRESQKLKIDYKGNISIFDLKFRY